MASKKYFWLFAALLTSCAIRVTFVVLFFGNLRDDPDAYQQIAENISANGIYGQGFGNGPLQPTAFRPPLYPMILSQFVVNQSLSVMAVAVFHVVLGVASVFFCYRFSNRIGVTPICCFAISILVSLDPILLKQSTLIMTETIAMFMAVVCIDVSIGCFQRNYSTKRYLLLGLLIGISALCRPTFLIWGGLLFLALIIKQCSQPKTNLQSATLRLFGFAAMISVVLSPWMIRNQVIFGKPVFATTHGGYTIFLGNNDNFYDYLRSGRTGVWDGESELKNVVSEIRIACRQHDGKIDEIKKDKLYYDKAIETIRRRPGDFAYAVWIRAVRFWSIIPSKSNARQTKMDRVISVGSAVWYSVVFTLAGIGLLSSFFTNSGRSVIAQFFPALLMVIAFAGLHLVYWSNMRMRAPLTAIIALFAIYGLNFLMNRFRQLRKNGK